MKNEVLLSNIRKLCKNNNITVAQLEKKMGMGAGTISRWNKASPAFDKVVSIARYFKVSIDYLSGYDVSSEETIKLDENTIKIVDYLLEMTTEAEENESFWNEYKIDIGDKAEPWISNLSEMKLDINDIGKLFYAYDEMGYYLLKVVYALNECYDYKTQIQLYLTPDELTIPVLECDDKNALQPLYIAAITRLEALEDQKIAKERVQIQREKIIKKYNDRNES